MRVRNLKRSKERDPIEGGKKARKASEEGSSGSDLRNGSATQDEQVGSLVNNKVFSAFIFFFKEKPMTKECSSLAN